MKLNLLVIGMLGAACIGTAFYANSIQPKQGVEVDLVPTQLVQEHQEATTATSDEESIAWKDDPICQMVFFAVLEGLYTQGVSDEVVDSIVGAKCDPADTEKMKERLKRSFVVDCPLCQPTFEAFIVYQSRPRFSDGSGANNFGNGFDASLKERLLSENLQTRLEALKVFVQDSVSKKIANVDMTEKEFADWGQRVMNRFSEGKNNLLKLVRNDEHYRDWGVYWGCAACNGSKEAVDAMKAEKR